MTSDDCGMMLLQDDARRTPRRLAMAASPGTGRHRSTYHEQREPDQSSIIDVTMNPAAGERTGRRHTHQLNWNP
jgi:hypothetical protein